MLTPIYLGDSVFAFFDGNGIELRLEAQLSEANGGKKHRRKRPELPSKVRKLRKEAPHNDQRRRRYDDAAQSRDMLRVVSRGQVEDGQVS
jgi:hypothetical protein